MENPYEKQHRFLKAVRIVDSLEELQIPVEAAKVFPEQQKQAVAMYANVGKPSAVSWDTAMSLYEKRVPFPFVKRAMTEGTGSGFTQLQ